MQIKEFIRENSNSIKTLVEIGAHFGTDTILFLFHHFFMVNLERFYQIPKLYLSNLIQRINPDSLMGNIKQENHKFQLKLQQTL